MKRTLRSGLIRVAVAPGLALLLGACGTTGTSTSATRTHLAARPPALSVTPDTGAPTTVFELRFTAPASTGTSGGSRRGFQLGVSGPRRPGCVGASSEALPSATRGASVDVGLDPAKLGGRWCPGTYFVRVDEFQAPACSPGMMCPQFVRVVGIVGRAQFRVVAAA
jgi:hypothetical protein